MKQVLLLLFASLMIISTGCSNKKTTIGFLMDTENIERWKKDKELFIESVKSLDAEVVVAVAESDPQKQYDQALEMIKKGVEVLVIIPVDMERAGQIAEEAFKVNVPVISYDRLIRNGPLAFYISTDNIEIGKMQANYLKQIKASGNYVLITGPERDNNATLLRRGWHDELQPSIDNGSINIVKDVFSNAWVADEAYFVIKELIANDSQFDAIICGNDVLASGALMALNENNLQGKVLLAGQDAELMALRNIVAGHQTISIAKPIDKLARAAAQAAINVAEGKNIDYNNTTTDNGLMKVPTITLQARVVNKKNIILRVEWEDNTDNQEVFE